MEVQNLFVFGRPFGVIVIEFCCFVSFALLFLARKTKLTFVYVRMGVA
jgi:hypothetical protein